MCILEHSSEGLINAMTFIELSSLILYCISEFAPLLDCEQSLFFFLQSYCRQKPSRQAAKPLAARNEGVSPRRKNPGEKIRDC